jgi:hypothetical protein
MLRHSTPELNPNLRRKRGIGIMEVLVAALVLGLLYLAVSRLQSGNRDALLRIRGRDGATEVAQNIIDEMSSRGLASFTEENLIENADGTWSLAKLGGDDGKTKVKDLISVTRSWEGQPGIIQNTMEVTYTVDVKFSSDEDYKVQSGSLLLLQDPTKPCSDDANKDKCVSHIYAKRVDVTVSWPFKNSTQSISVSGVIR